MSEHGENNQIVLNQFGGRKVSTHLRLNTYPHLKGEYCEGKLKENIINMYKK